MHLKLAAGLLMAGACLAQGWEIGAGVGYGAYRKGAIVSPNGTADAGIRNRYVVTAVVNQDMSDRFSGEVRYLYHAGETFLASGAAQGSVKAQSHALHYDILIHLLPRDRRIRPFVAGGIGAKFYETTGSTPIPQPLPRIAGLTSQSQWKPVYVFGGGVKVRVKDHLILRADIRDYLTAFPAALFAPVANSSTPSLLHQITPLVGLGYSF